MGLVRSKARRREGPRRQRQEKLTTEVRGKDRQRGPWEEGQ